jgi:hypothetical protein
VDRPDNRASSAQIASTASSVTSLKESTDSRDTLRSRFSGACASRSQNIGRATSVSANASAMSAAVAVPGENFRSRSSREADHSCQPSAVSRRKICSRVSK